MGFNGLVNNEIVGVNWAVGGLMSDVEVGDKEKLHLAALQRKKRLYRGCPILILRPVLNSSRSNVKTVVN